MTVQELFSAAQELSLPEQIQLASELMQTAAQKLHSSFNETTINSKEEEDPLIGLFDGPPELATRSEEVLAQEVNSASGFTWKA